MKKGLAKGLMLSALSALSLTLVGTSVPLGVDAAVKKSDSGTITEVDYSEYQNMMRTKVALLKAKTLSRSKIFDGDVEKVFDMGLYVKDKKIVGMFKELEKLIADYRTYLEKRADDLQKLDDKIKTIKTKKDADAVEAAFKKLSDRKEENRLGDRVLIKGESIGQYTLDQQDYSIELYRKDQAKRGTNNVSFLDVHKLLKKRFNSDVSKYSKAYIARQVAKGVKRTTAENKVKSIKSHMIYSDYLYTVYDNPRYDEVMNKIYLRKFDDVHKNRAIYAKLIPDGYKKMDSLIAKKFK